MGQHTLESATIPFFINLHCRSQSIHARIDGTAFYGTFSSGYIKLYYDCLQIVDMINLRRADFELLLGCRYFDSKAVKSGNRAYGDATILIYSALDLCKTRLPGALEVKPIANALC